MKHTIKHRFTGATLFEIEADSLLEAVRWAIKSAQNLSRADLYGADLSDEQLLFFRDDIWAVMSGAALEAEGLRQAIADGKINGSVYEGECACLVGTIAKVAGKHYQDLPLIKPNTSRPAEQFFMFIREGDKPDTSRWSKLALEWVDQWIANMKLAFGKAGL